VRAAEARSFTDAGRQLGLSSSAIGKAVARLEERLGVRLFHRSTRSIALTEEGKLFLESCRRIFQEIERVGSLPLIGMLMMPTLSRFMLARPDIELDVEFTDHLVDVIDGGYDVVIRSGQAEDSLLMARKLGTYRLEVVGSPKYFARAGRPSSPNDLIAHACLHHKYPTNGRIQRWPFAASAAGADFALPMTATATTVEALVALAEHGVGLACVPDFSVRKQIADGSLVIVLGEFIEHVGMFRALWPSSRYVPPKVRVFVDYMAKHLFAPAPANTATAGLDLSESGVRPQRL
jgi:DNA-binding transcriptional LysR family regulator